MKAKTIDKLDSPILYAFYNQVVKRNVDKALFSNIEERRKNYLSDERIIDLIDHGAGSAMQSSKKRSIASIASTAVSSSSKCALLYKICQHFSYQNGLELGTSLGISALYMKMANKASQLTTIEGDPIIGQLIKTSLEQESIRSITGTFDEVLPHLNVESSLYDLVYIDGGHRSDLIQNVMKLLDNLTNRLTVLIIDDIYWSSDMTSAWRDLKASDDYNVAIDLWHFGILYYDERAKESIDVVISPIDRRWTFGFFR